MGADPILDELKTVATGFDQHELDELRHLGDRAYGETAGLLAALAHVADWEWHRRQGIQLTLLLPARSIDDWELGACLEFVPALSAEFPHQPVVQQLLAAIARALTAGTRH